MDRGFAEEPVEDVEEVGTLEEGGLGDRGEDRDVVGAGLAAGAHADFAEDDHGAQRTLGVIVGGRPLADDECEEPVVFRRVWQEALAQGLGFDVGN